MSKKVTTADFVKRARAFHGDFYDYSKSVYVRKDLEVVIGCPLHGEFKQQPNVHYRSKCPACSGRQTMSQSRFLERAREMHGDFYDYSKVVFKNMRDKVVIGCPVHGGFLQDPFSHVNGTGCKKCSALVAGSKKLKGLDWFLQKAKEHHGNFYDYSKVSFTRLSEKVVIICPTHGEFTQQAAKHSAGAGCWGCMRDKVVAIRRKDNAHFLKVVKAAYGDTYDYSKVKYKGKDYPVDIVCPTHGVFSKTAGKHMYSSQGCPKCACIGSKPEKEVRDFVTSLGFNFVERDRTVLEGKELDMLCLENKVAIEFCGTYWHSTLPYASRKEATKNDVRTGHYRKYKACEEKGIRLITLFSDEWETKREVVEKTLKHVLGAGDKFGYARNYTVAERKTKDIKEFYNSNHLQGSPAGGISFCLERDGKLFAAMSFASTTSIRGTDRSLGVWELIRFCAIGSIAGAASRLFSAFVKKYDPQTIVSYSDNRWFSGEMYPMLGFVFASGVPVDYTVFNNQWAFRKHKGQFKRANIPARIKELGLDLSFDPETDPRSEFEITHEMGCGQVYDCGKKKWVWSKH